jgi:hypothetical protein
VIDIEGNDLSWLDQVRRGDFSAIPQPLDWAQGAHLAQLLYGYDVSTALGFGELAFWANERADEAATARAWHGTATELWLCLFYEHRRFRHFGFAPQGEDLILVDQLCRQLHDQLQAIGEAERRTIVEQIAISAARLR